MKMINSIKIFALSLSVAMFFSSCEKGPDQSESLIQQGNTTIQINAISPDVYNILQVRYNNVINAPIKATIRFTLKDGQQKEAQITIPANYKNLQQWDENKFINTWNYDGYYDSTGNTPAGPIDRSWDIASVKITAVSCPDKEYGFKVITSEDWIFYQPKDSITSVSFISNKDTVSYSDYDFIAPSIQYHKTTSAYNFSFFRSKVMMFSGIETYPLNEGMIINIPLMVYKHNSRPHGSQPDGPQASSNGSTIKLTITKLTGTHFDATFSGKLWSSLQADTLHISNGKIKNAVLPQRVD